MVSPLEIMAHYYTARVAVFCAIAAVCSGACTFPSAIQGSWISSEKNDLVFTTTTFSGYTVHVFSTDTFTCETESNGQYMAKSATFKRFGLDFYAYLCLDFTEIVANKLYQYHKMSAEEPDANNERVKIVLASLASGITISDVCTVSDKTDMRYSLLMLNGSSESVKQTCPIPFLGNFGYTYDTGSGNLCPNESSVNVCDTKNTMTWDYTQCSQIQAYSAGGVTNCLYSSSSNNVYTVHVYNQDATTDQSTTYRMTCYQAFGYKMVWAAQYPGDCPAAMNYTYAPSPGAALLLVSSVVCAYDEETSLSAGVIAAIVICCIIFVIIIIALVIWYFYRKRKKRKQAEWEAANRKIDPDELSPNMRLGLPNESKYDLDRLMYSPDMKNGLIKRSPRKDMMGLEGLEGYNESVKYMDEEQRQTALEAHMFTEKRKRKDNKDEFKAASKQNKVFSDRIKEMAKGRRKPFKAAALARIKLRPRARPMVDTPEDGRATKAKDIVIQVEEAEGESKRKTRFADETDNKEGLESRQGQDQQKATKVEDVETLSDIVDNEMGVDDLSDDEKEPRLKLPNLRPPKKEKRKRNRFRRAAAKAKGKGNKMVITKYVPFTPTPFIKRVVIYRPQSRLDKKPPPPKKPKWYPLPVKRPPSEKSWSALVRRLKITRVNQVSPMLNVPPISHKLHDRFSLGVSQVLQGMPHNTRFVPPKSRQNTVVEESTEPLPLMKSPNNNWAKMHPLARIHRKDNPKAWKEAFGESGMESMDLEELKRNLPENRWKKLLEELYRDKKYFDYVKKSTSNNEENLFSAADESLQFLYGRALFWEQKEPLPPRPPTHVKRMYSRYENPKSGSKSSKSLQRSATTGTRSGHKRLPRTPSTQVSKMKRRERLDKRAKEEANQNENNFANGDVQAIYYEGGTQTDFSPVPPLTPVMVSQEDHYADRISLPGSVIEEERETPSMPFVKEITRSDIKLEYDYDHQQYDAGDGDTPFMEDLEDVEDVDNFEEEREGTNGTIDVKVAV